MLKTYLTGPKQGPKHYSALCSSAWINDFRQNNFRIEKKEKRKVKLIPFKAIIGSNRGMRSHIISEQISKLLAGPGD